MNKKIKVLICVASLAILPSLLLANKDIEEVNASSTEVHVETVEEALTFSTEVDEEIVEDVAIETIDKDYIYDKMLNTIDNFESVVGKFDYYNYHMNNGYNVDYTIRLSDERSSYQKITFSDGQIQETLYNGETIVFTDTKDLSQETLRTATDAELEKHDVAKNKRSRERIEVDDEGIKTYYYRQDITNTTFEKQSILPQELTFSYLSDFNNWSIEGIDEYGDKDAVVIVGSLTDEGYANKLNVKDFKLWVEPNTGILLKYEGYSANNQLTEELKTQNIVINGEVKDNAFEKDFSMYKN